MGDYTFKQILARLKGAITDEIHRRRLALEKYHWHKWARPNQLPPVGDWKTWVILAGRGFGKTRTGAETIRMWVKQGDAKRIAIIGETESEVRQVMVEGESGILAAHPDDERPDYEVSKNQITWKNGATAYCYGGDNYEKLRGPQFDAAWVDELAKFRDPESTWQQLMFCLRLGDNPRVIVTTTPRTSSFLKELINAKDVVVTKGTTFENAKNLAKAFIESMKDKFMNTSLGKQELMAEFIDQDKGALWTWEMIDKARKNYNPDLEIDRIVVAIDPAATSGEGSDETGIIVAAKTACGHGIILDDLSIKASPLEWAKCAVNAYYRYDADRIVAEINMGGEMVEQMLRSVDQNVSYSPVRATRGKTIRAEPIASLYEQGKIMHAKPLPILESQMSDYIQGISKKSPDRLDALVWALTDLMLVSPRQNLESWLA